MSSRLIKNGSPIAVVGDETIVKLSIFKSGTMQLEAPSVHPKELCKMLSNLIHDITYASLQPAEIPKIQPPM